MNEETSNEGRPDAPLIITPTVGRVMWYRPGPYDFSPGHSVVQYEPELEASKRQPLEARVIFVWSDRCVNLKVTDHAGNDHVRTSVYVKQPDDRFDPPEQNFAEWMPYQAGQARKA